MPLPKTDLEELKRAKLILENPGLAAKLANYVGSPVEQGMKLLPKSWQKGVHSATEKALMKALEVAVRSLGERRRATSSDRFHKVAVATSGAIGLGRENDVGATYAAVENLLVRLQHARYDPGAGTPDPRIRKTWLTVALAY